MNELLNQLLIKEPCDFSYNLQMEESESSQRLIGTLKYGDHTHTCSQTFSGAGPLNVEDAAISIYRALFSRLKDRLSEELTEKLADKPETPNA